MKIKGLLPLKTYPFTLMEGSSIIFTSALRFKTQKDYKIFACKFLKNVKSKLYHIENSKTIGQTVKI